MPLCAMVKFLFSTVVTMYFSQLFDSRFQVICCKSSSVFLSMEKKKSDFDLVPTNNRMKPLAAKGCSVELILPALPFLLQPVLGVQGLQIL